MSDILNSYCTLTEFRKYITPPNQTIHEDTDDDEVIEDLIEVASRRVDDLTGREFYPHVETLAFDIPYDNDIWFGDDVLEVLSFLNGDGSAITSSDYLLDPPNFYPKYKLHLRDTSNLIFIADTTTASEEQVLSINAVLGYHNSYAKRAWKAAGTISVAMSDTTTLTISVTAGHSLEARGGEILKIGTELFNSSEVVGNTLTVQARGDNGSTAATHLILAPVYKWVPIADISHLTLEIANVMNHSRYGENVDVVSTYTPAGIVVTPRSLPVWAQEVIRRYQRLV